MNDLTPSPNPSSPAGRDGSGRRLSPTARLLMWWGLLAVAGLVAFVAVRATTSDEPAASPVTTARAEADGAPGSSTVTTAVSPLPPGASTSAPAPSEVATAPPPAPVAPAPSSTTSSVAPGDVPEDRSTDGGPPDWVSEDGCDPGYLGTCIPRPPAKVTCDDISETNFQVLGNDAQGLDPDGNGMACEQLNNQPNPNRTPEEMREFEKVD